MCFSPSKALVQPRAFVADRPRSCSRLDSRRESVASASCACTCAINHDIDRRYGTLLFLPPSRLVRAIRKLAAEAGRGRILLPMNKAQTLTWSLLQPEAGARVGRPRLIAPAPPDGRALVAGAGAPGPGPAKRPFATDFHGSRVSPQ